MKKYLIISLAVAIALGSLGPRIEARHPKKNNSKTQQVCKKIRSTADKFGNAFLAGGAGTALIAAIKKSSVAGGIGAGIFGAGLLLKLIGRKKNKKECNETQNKKGKR